MRDENHRLNKLIDAVLLAGFVLACFLDLTGQEAHQWLGMAIAALALYHLWRHQAWALAVGRRWLSGLANRARLYALIDLGLFVGITGVISTGVVHTRGTAAAMSTRTRTAVATGANAADLRNRKGGGIEGAKEQSLPPSRPCNSAED